jgi:dUTP pyrophosphatase
MQLNVKLLHPNATAPNYAHFGDSGLDLYSIEDFTLEPGEFKAIGTGIAIELPVGHEGQVRPRSGLALKHGVTVLNAPGTVDFQYRGEVKVILINHGKTAFSLKAGEKAIAQLVIASVVSAQVEVVTDVSDSNRGQNGFGSTDNLTGVFGN